MKIFLATDHRGFYLKEELKDWLSQLKIAAGGVLEVVDVGNNVYDQNDDFPDFVSRATTQAVAQGEKAVVFCGSGAGANIAANKINGARATLGMVKEQVVAARADDDINILVVAADYVQADRAQEMIQAFVETDFAGQDRHKRRLAKIAALENNL